MTDIDKVKNIQRYQDFTYFEEPVMFDDYFKGKDYDVVQVHDINPISETYKDPIGFAGSFEWKSNTIKPLDYDSYTPKMPIWGFNEFKNKDGLECVDILTDRW